MESLFEQTAAETRLGGDRSRQALKISALVAVILATLVAILAQLYWGRLSPGRQDSILTADNAPSAPVLDTWEEPDGLVLGQEAPDFELSTLRGEPPVSLSSFRGKKPVVLAFGSYTCPRFREQVDAFNNIHREYSDRFEFLLVYIREAHPDDPGPYEWKMLENERAGIHVNHPKTYEERASVAGVCAEGLNIACPVLIDGLDNRVSDAYSAWPTRAMIVDAGGKVAFKIAPGPQGFDMKKLKEGLDAFCKQNKDKPLGAWAQISSSRRTEL